MTTTKTIELMLEHWPPQMRRGFRVPHIAHNLVSVAEICDAGGMVVFSQQGVEIEFEGEIIGRGWRDPTNRLWRIPITSEGAERIIPPPAFNTSDLNNGLILSINLTALYDCKSTAQLVKYYHACFGSHPVSTLIAAVKKGYLRGCPGFTEKNIRKYLGNEEATDLGHMKLKQQGTRSTTTISNRGRPRKQQGQHGDDAIDDAQTIPAQEPHNKKTHAVFMATAAADGLIASDQTGSLPRISTRGMRYLCIFYIYDANAIKAIPIKSRRKEELLRAYKEMYEYCEARGFKPKMHKLDNETSKEVEVFITSQRAQYQYTPPDIHRTNPAERAIQTYKACAKSTFASLPKTFPIAYWCRLIPQIDLSVNIVRPCRQNPFLSAWTALEGEFHFDATPLAPPGTEMLLHERSSRRASWAYNAKKAWYIGPCLHHYRNVRAIMKDTGAERIGDTFRFHHHVIAVPEITPAERIVHAAEKLEDAIKQQPEKAPLAEHDAIAMLRQILLGERRRVLSPSQPTTINSKVSIHKPRTTTMTQQQKVICNAPNYISDDESDMEDEPMPEKRRRSKRLREKKLSANKVSCQYEPQHKSNKIQCGWAKDHVTVQQTERAPDTFLAGAIIDDVTGKAMEYRDLIQHDKYKDVWQRSYANELGRLAQGIRDIPGTDTIFFIARSEIPKERWKDVTYGRIVVDYRPQKADPYRTRLTVGGDRINYPFDVSTPTADLTTIKMLWNSTISSKKARFCTMDVKNFYLMTPMERPEFMRLPISLLPPEIIAQYKLQHIVEDGWVYLKIVRGMYGLPQAGLLANQLLKQRLQKHGYFPCQFTPGLWKYVWRPITFTLVVDDFGIKSDALTHTNHLKRTLEKYYEVTVDWKGSLYVGIQLEWNYDKGFVDTHMPGYIPKALIKFQHPHPKQAQHAPATAVPIVYGAKIQEAPKDTSPPLAPAQIKRIQDIVGTLVYYARAVDPTLSATLSSIASRQTKGTQKLEEEVKQLLDYCATHPNSGVRYVASDMILNAHSDASYLSEPDGRSRAGGHFYLSKHNDENFNNGAILTLSTIIKHVMASASEAELAALFYNSKAAVPLRVTLQEMGHPQPPTLITSDNTTAHGLITKVMTPKAEKSMDMRFHFLKYREAQRQFRYLWRRAHTNRADYHTKKHPKKHYITNRRNYVVDMPRRQ